MEQVSFKRIDDYNESDIAKAMSDLLTPFVSAIPDLTNKRVLLKPNLLLAESPEKCVTTHPAIIHWCIHFFEGRGAKVVVGDSPAIGNTLKVAEKCGLHKALQGTSAELVNFEEEIEYIQKPPYRYQKMLLTSEIKKADYIVNLAKVKTHGQMSLTLATKNLFGCVVGMKKPGWHLQAGKDHEHFAEMLLSVAAFINADLHILDGIIGMDGNGPRGGNPKTMGFLSASNNSHALDLFTAKLLGFTQNEVPTLHIAKKYNLPGTSFEDIAILGDDPGALKIKDFRRARPAHPGFNLPPWLHKKLEKWLTPLPVINPEKCVNCGVCANICPVNTIEKLANTHQIHHNKCIHCFCCQETCGFEAITIKKPLLLKLFSFFH